MTKPEPFQPLPPLPVVPTGENGRTGKVFTMRLADNERERLTTLAKQAEPIMPWRPERRRSLGAFLVWAALQWRPAQLELAPKKKAPRPRPVPRRRRRGITKRPGRGGRRPTGKKGRRS